MASLPTGATVSSATLSLYPEYLSSDNLADQPVKVYALNSQWDEAAVTWDVRAASTAWSSKGGDFGSALSGAEDAFWAHG